MIRILLPALVLLGLVPLAVSAADTITFDSLLKEMVDVDAIARWPQPEFTCHQASSYDRAKVAPDKPGWFSNNDNTQYLRTEIHAGRSEQVMMEAEGPGALVRGWLTAGGSKGGVLRVYLDGNEFPVLTFPAFDFLQGDLNLGAPLAQPHPGYSPTEGGNNLYLPIPYSQHCKVTWEEQSAGQRYYQINYRTYTPGTPVTTFSLPQLEASRQLIAQVNRTLESPSQFSQGTVATMNDIVPAGKETSLDLLVGANAIRILELRMETDDPAERERTLRGMILKLTFDDEVTVWCPATDFFGTAIGINPLHSWYRQVLSDGTMRCRWVMPSEKNARSSLTIVGPQSVKATLHATTSARDWNDRSMHFHATWHHESDLKTPPVSDWNFVQIQGRGVYVGDSLALFNPMATWYGEGDEKIWVDGESFPSHLGTGTEDYYGYSYAPKGIIQTPFNNHVRIDEPMTQGWNVMSRTRQLDGIPFRRSLKFDMELMSWKPTTLTYAATTYWYAFPGATSNLSPQPKAAALPVPTLAEARAEALAAIPHRPGAIECEGLKILNKSGDIPTFSQDMSPWDSTRWSGGHQLTVKAGRVGDFVELEIPVPDDKPRQVVLYVTSAPDFGTLRFVVNGKPSETTFDGYATDVQPADSLKLGLFTPENGGLKLRAEVTGANPESVGARYFFGLDCVVLKPAS